MNKEIISKATRNAFQKEFTRFSREEIEEMFDAADIPQSESLSPMPVVERYYANIDFSNPEEVSKAVIAFGALIDKLGEPTFLGQFDDALQRQSDILVSKMQRDGFQFEDGKFISPKLTRIAVSTPLLIALTEESISEHIEKANAKIEGGDAAGAIASAYTLVEGFLKEILRQTQTPFKESEGDIKTLYTSVAEPLNLNPKGENLEGHLKTILHGLKSLITGLYEVANKASDRHARQYNPAPHHAKLAVNTSLTLCEFILDSYKYQQQMKSKKAKG